MFAAPVDMEPGMVFRTYAEGAPLRFAGVERVVSRFAGRRRVRVFTGEGVSFVCDRDRRFQVVDFRGSGRG